MTAQLHEHPILKEILEDIVEIDNRHDLQLHIASPHDREAIIAVINSVADERKYLQTERYCPSPVWERLLSCGINIEEGLLLLVAESNGKIVGFARLSPDSEHPLGRNAGNIGLAFLPLYRSQGFGAIILNKLIGYAIDLDYQVLTADVFETNIRSKKLFAGCGFNVVKVTKKKFSFLEKDIIELRYQVELSSME
jgi:RimJ/RimL family protein N-acetyltransferase